MKKPLYARQAKADGTVRYTRNGSPITSAEFFKAVPAARKTGIHYVKRNDRAQAAQHTQKSKLSDINWSDPEQVRRRLQTLKALANS